MTKHASLLVTLLALTSVADAATDSPWDGVYAGLNVGSSQNSSCKGGVLNGAALDPSIAVAFENPPCSGNSAFVGGIQIGENVQYQHLVVGLGIDLDTANAEKAGLSRQFAGTPPPPGTYVFSGRFSPSRFALIAPRIGYATLQSLVYLKAGAVLAGGSHNSTLSYLAPGAKTPTASFSGGNTFATTGWAAGGGIEYGFNGPWSITAEYLHESLGKGADSTGGCSGSPSACAAFSGIVFNSVHGNFTANIICIGVNYWFGYWGQ